MDKDNIPSIKVDDDPNTNISMLVSLLPKGYWRNKASFLRDILGLYLLANGTTARRSIDTLNHLGVTPSYQTLNKMLGEMAKGYQRKHQQGGAWSQLHCRIRQLQF
jgi:hypothetical protein